MTETKHTTQTITKKCKWCGKPFKATHNRQQYGTTGIHKFKITKKDGTTEETTCKQEATRERKKLNEQHQYRIKQKYKSLIQKPSNKTLGTTNHHMKHRKKDFKQEYYDIQKELKRIGLRK